MRKEKSVAVRSAMKINVEEKKRKKKTKKEMEITM